MPIYKTKVYREQGGAKQVVASAGEVEIQSGGTFDLQSGASAPRLTITDEVTFTQTAGDGTYTGTISLPANSRIIDIGVDGQALWAGGASASMIVGDGTEPDGFFTTTDLYATDLLAGEINNIEHPGGKAGAYIASEQRKLYQAAARDIIGVVTAVGAGTAGRTRLYVTYAVMSPTAATKA